MFRISHELRLKLLNHDKARLESHMTPLKLKHCGQEIKVPGISWNEVILDLKDDPELFKECEDWRHVRMKYIKNRVDTKVSLGRYEGLWPTVCDERKMTVTFLVDTVNNNDLNWRDWFLEGEAYAPQ